MSYFDSDTLTAIASGRLVRRRFVHAEFAEGAAGWWADAGDITVDGITFRGDCVLGPASGIGGTSDLSMQNVTQRLSAADPGILDDFMLRHWRFRAITLQCLLFDPSMRSIHPTPWWRGRGLMEKVSHLQSTADECVIEVKVADFLSRGLRSPAAFRTDGDQRMRLSTDSAFRYVSTVDRTVDVSWGTRQAAYGNAVVRGISPTKV